MDKKQVSIIMGSDSDLSVMKESALILEEFGVGYDMQILSAHRCLPDLKKYLDETTTKVIIAGAGAAAHLPGLIAAHVYVPVIGVPINSTNLNGVDSLYSIVQMPGGIPVASMAIGVAGAKNAALFAIQILSVGNVELGNRLQQKRQLQAKQVIQKNTRLQQLGFAEYLSQKKSS